MQTADDLLLAFRAKRGPLIAAVDAYDAYCSFCRKTGLKHHTRRAFGDLLSELDIYSFLRTRVFSWGRYGRNKEIELELPSDLLQAIENVILINFDLHPSDNR